jgi:DNA polymerase-3 subunit gamma/tau
VKNSEALYRKYRFQTFSDIFGQDHISQTLRNAIKHGRVSHAYLFSGPRGTGKTSTARLLARALNCSNEETLDPCGTCDNCLSIENGSFMDIIELDAASHTGVDHIRSLIDESAFHPTQGRYKIYIIDEAHMLSQAANNAFLKTLEEPPPHVIFILATTEAQKIIQTIHSRCQCFHFKRIAHAGIVERLRQIVDAESLERSAPIEVDLNALTLIAKSATGSMRDAISTLEQVLAFTDEKVTIEDVLTIIGTVSQETLTSFINHIIDRDIRAGLLLIEEMTEAGVSFNDFFLELIHYLRNLLLLVNDVTEEEILQTDAENIPKMRELAGKVNTEIILEILKVVNRFQMGLRNVTDLKLHLELLVIETISALKEREESSIYSYLSEDFLDRLMVLEGHVNFLLEGGGQPAAEAATKPQTDAFKPQRMMPRKRVEPVMEPPRPRKPEVLKETPKAPAPEKIAPIRPRPAPVIEGEITFHSIAGMWDYILEKVKERKAQTHAMLVEGRPASLEKDLLTIRFPAKFDWHAGQVREQSRRTDVELTLYELLGQRLRVEVIVEGAEDAAAEAEDQSSDLVGRVLDLFGGEIET